MKTLSLLTHLSILLFAIDPALAASGTQSINTLFTQILTVLQGVSVVVVTCALVWAGYRVMYTEASIRQVAGPVMGAILVAAAPWLADLLVG